MIIDFRTRLSDYAGLLPGIDLAADFLRRSDLGKMADGKYPLDGDRVYAMLQSYQSLDPAAGKLEAHRRYVDLQTLLEGAEHCGYACLDAGLEVSQPYDPETDCGLHEGPCDFFRLTSSNFALLWPQDAHMPGRWLDGQPVAVRKVVVKIRLP